MQLEKYVDKTVKENKSIDLKSVMGKFSLDNLPTCAFEVDAQSFTNKGSLFVKHARMIFRRAPGDVAIFLTFIFPGFSRFFNAFNIPIFKPEEIKFLVNAV